MLRINHKQLARDKKYLMMAKIWASNSISLRRQVGVLIVKDKAIISDGYNGTPRGFNNICETTEVCKKCGKDFNKSKPEVLHAEANALMKLATSTSSSKGATLYTTTSPCYDCAKLIIQAEIPRVVYSSEYRNDLGVKLLKKANIEVIYVNID